MLPVYCSLCVSKNLALLFLCSHHHLVCSAALYVDKAETFIFSEATKEHGYYVPVIMAMVNVVHLNFIHTTIYIHLKAIHF